MRCDAAGAYQAMAQAFGRAFGKPLCITDSYRTFAAQVRLYGEKPALAAVPGTSNHGWGMAVDLCGGVQSFAAPEYRWMAANAGAFGWSNPAWARPGRGREEPWHWEYTG
ncbi:M15 family metallopeptidase [Actinokineospora soli]|uniref:M15 family metallopeptidase n=1 Tax=Actinokineospora soli TaxID=1048753 RepID=A0ABW2TLQ3_9PSEU